MQENYEIFKDLIHIVGLHYYLDILKKKKKNLKMQKKSSENDQLTGDFQSFLFP